MRERIVEAAHGLFRHYGHAKATVADIAEACGVSTANVYRFFGSKSEINDTICALVLSRLVEDLDAIATAAAPAASRLAQMAERVALFNRQSARSDGRIHEMLIAAVVEDWDAIRQFFREVQLHFAAVVADGIATGEFAAGDPDRAARFLCFALAGFWHPLMSDRCRDLSEVREPAELMDFLLADLRAGRAPV